MNVSGRMEPKIDESQTCSYSLVYCYYSVAKYCPTLCVPMDCSMPGSSVLHCLPEFDEHKLSLYSSI